MGVAGCIRCIRADTACYIKLFDVAIQLMYRADTSKTVAKLGRDWHCNLSVGSLSAHYVLYLTNMECHDELLQQLMKQN